MQMYYLKKEKNHLVFYRGFAIRTFPVYEDTESRLARKDWQSLIIGYSATIRYQDHPWHQDKQGKLIWQDYTDEIIYPTPEIVIEEIEGAIDYSYERWG